MHLLKVACDLGFSLNSSRTNNSNLQIVSVGWELKWSQKICALTKPCYNVHVYKSFTHNTGYLTIHLVFDRYINNRQKKKKLLWPICTGFSIKVILNWCRLAKVYGIFVEARRFSFLFLASNLLHGVSTIGPSPKERI